MRSAESGVMNAISSTLHTHKEVMQMRTRPTLPDSGMQIDNLLTMALKRRTRKRSSLPLVIMALLGGVSLVLTFLSMFPPACSRSAVILTTVGSLLFFSWHADTPKGKHLTLFAFMLGYVAVFFHYRLYAANGLVFLMNAICQTIYKTDWLYFEPMQELPAQVCTTFLLCMLVVPIMGLLAYAVVRYHNFFLSLLVTFPFVEIGFFFGIAAEHFPASAMFAFWCGMAAVQLASSGITKSTGKIGFMRRRNAFFPVAGMRFMLTEKAGVVTATAVLLLCLSSDLLLGAMQYERPEMVKEMRTEFQYYVAAIDWSDLSTLVPPFLRKNTSNTEASTQIELGRDEAQEFEEIAMSRVYLDGIPESRVYLRYRSAQVYGSSQWTALDDAAYDVQIIEQLGELNCYPPQFLYYAAREGGTILELTMQNAVPPLSKCIPYGFRETAGVSYRNDDIRMTSTDRYSFFGGMDYENLIMNSRFVTMTVGDLSDQLEPKEQRKLELLVNGNRNKTVQMPAASVSSLTADKAAILSACGYTEFARENYLSLPELPELETIRGMYADLLEGFDAEAASPQEAVYELQLLRERLCSEVSYSLSPGKTPPYEDFVSWFMLESKQGYCMHYASAGVILARMAGIPARYCDGYLVEPDQLQLVEDGGSRRYTTEILDSNAHAWCEVFLEGVGWIPFEFTYTYFTPPPLGEEEEPATEDPEPVTEPQATAPAPTGHTALHETEAPTTEPTTETLPEEEIPDGTWLYYAAVLLLAAAVAGGVALARQLALQRRSRSFGGSDRQAAANHAWRWLLTLLRMCGTDTKATTAARLIESAGVRCAAYLEEHDIEEALAVGAKLRYSPHSITEEELNCLVETAQELAEGLYNASGAIKRFRLKWFRHIV